MTDPRCHLAGVRDALDELEGEIAAIRAEAEHVGAARDKAEAEAADLRTRLENVRMRHDHRGMLLNLARGQLRYLHGWSDQPACVDNMRGKDPVRAGTALLVGMLEAEIGQRPASDLPTELDEYEGDDAE